MRAERNVGALAGYSLKDLSRRCQGKEEEERGGEGKWRKVEEERGGGKRREGLEDWRTGGLEDWRTGGGKRRGRRSRIWKRTGRGLEEEQQQLLLLTSSRQAMDFCADLRSFLSAAVSFPPPTSQPTRSARRSEPTRGRQRED
eukprot:764259-Hanusia_phi.AAC.3